MREPLVVAMTVLVAVACTPSYPPCYRGEYRGCTCAGGAPGYAACSANEDGFEACLCGGSTPGVDGGRDAAPAGEAGGASDAGAASDAPEGSAAGDYMTPCGPNDSCSGEGARCFEFGNRGKICTRTCAQPADCPPPSPGCGNQGVCRAP